ncbi:MAG: glutamate synthase subunit alpha, partial [Clostridiales bacterium]
SSGHVERYMEFVARETIEILEANGFASLDEIIGRSDLLRKKDNLNLKAAKLHLDSVLYRPELPSRISRRFKPTQKDLAASRIDVAVADEIMESLAKGKQHESEHRITNRDRGIGAYLSGCIARKGFAGKLKNDTVELRLSGSAGQSLGAFLAKGVSIRLTGDANDYVGKSLSGGKIVIAPDAEMQSGIKDNMIAGNTVLYGASSGIFYGAGVVGDRFAIRNSGAVAVCEGIGNNGCEYMTGGTVVVLGKRGMNFASGMTGGKAYVLNEKAQSPAGKSEKAIGRELDDAASEELLKILKGYEEETKSEKAKNIIASWPASAKKFRLVE